MFSRKTQGFPAELDELGNTRGIERHPGIFQGLVGLDPPRSYTNDPSTINIPRGFLVSNITTFGVAKT